MARQVPLYGELSVKKNRGYYYLNVESFKKGDKIYIQVIVKDANERYLDISYRFCDTNYEEDFYSLDNREDFRDKKEDSGMITFYITVKLDKDAKYFLFQISNNIPELTIKHTKDNENSNITLIIIIIVVIVILLIGAGVAIFFLLKRKNRISSSDIEKSNI